jgi:PQQ-like domain
MSRKSIVSFIALFLFLSIASFLGFANGCGSGAGDTTTPPPPPPPPTAVGLILTQHNDNARTGQNLQETTLTPTNVTSATFGKLFSYPVDGAIYGQPLYVQNLTIAAQGVRNVVYVATEHDSVYAFDADQKSPGTLWTVNFTNSANGVTTVPCADEPETCEFVGTEIGISSTPVIDLSSKTLYVCAFTKEGGAYIHRLHALDLTTGAEKFGGPVVVQATAPGNGDGSSGGNLAFSSFTHLQRSALLLLNGVVYLTFAAYDDSPPYHGWVLGYDSQTLASVSVLNLTANGSDGGIWQSGVGPAADASGNVYVITGNGTFDDNTGGGDFGDSFVKLQPNANSLTVADYFSPNNQAMLSTDDDDLGSGGPLLLPDQTSSHPHLMLSGGKQGTLYLVDRDNMGHFNANDNSQIVQSLVGAVGAIFSGPAYWENKVYIGGLKDTIKLFSLSNGLLSTAPVSQSGATFGFPGAELSVSANGSENGILWALENAAYRVQLPAVLHAYDANDVSHELYNSTQAGTRDTLAFGVGFAVPSVANGKVYVGTLGELDVFGLIQ